MSFKRIFYAFGDGRVGFDCQSCGAACCKWGDFTATADQLVRLRKRRPDIDSYVATRSSTAVDVAYPGQPCFFLDADRRCSVYGDGTDTRPYNCWLFPANDFYLAGDALMVGLSFQCPLERTTDVGERLVHSGRDALIREFADNVAADAKPLPFAPDAAELAFERWCRDLIVLAPGRGLGEYVGLLEAAASTYPRCPALRRAAPAAARLRPFTDAVAELLGAPRGAITSAEPGANAIELISHLRLYLIRAGLQLAEVNRLTPRVAVALAAVAEHDGASTLSAMASLFGSAPYLFLVLAQCGHVPLSAPAAVELPPGRAGDELRGILAMYDRNRRARRTVGEIMQLAVPDPCRRRALASAHGATLLRRVPFARAERSRASLRD